MTSLKRVADHSSLPVRACRLFAHAVSRLLWRIEFHGVTNIPGPDYGGYVIASNHQTYIDPVWVSIPIKQNIRYLAWDRAFEWPLIGHLITWLGAMPVRLERGSTISSLRKTLEIVKNGQKVMVFPEAEREFSDGKLLEFRTGVVQIALKTGVPILPVTIVGGNKVWPRDYRIPRLRKVKVFYHKLIEPKSEVHKRLSKEQIAQLNEALRKTIESKLD